MRLHLRGAPTPPAAGPRRRRRLARVFCMDGGVCLRSVDVSATGRAEYAMPVPMGSPQSYYGVGHLVDEVVTPTTTRVSGQTNWLPVTSWLSGQWVNTDYAAPDNNQYARAN